MPALGETNSGGFYLEEPYQVNKLDIGGDDIESAKKTLRLQNNLQ